MDQLFASGRIVDGIVALVFVEAAALLAWRAFRGAGPAPLALLGNLAAGLFLLLALRGALDGSSAAWIGLCLLGALIAHLADLLLRWESARADSSARARPSLNATISLRVPKTPDPRPKR